MKKLSIKTQLIIFLSIFALYLSLRDKDFISFLSLFIAFVSSLAVDCLFVFFKERKFRLTESSCVSGLIIGLVLSSDNAWWKIVLVSVSAISSKHLIRFKGKHLFNPAAFGILSAMILLGVQTQWRGTYLWYILVPAGLYFIYKIRKLEVVIGYSLAALLLFGVQAVVQKAPLLNIFGYLSYFFIFIMLIEPKTTPVKSKVKLIFGLGVAILIFIFTEAGVKFDAELCGLLVMNLALPLLNKIPERRKA